MTGAPAAPSMVRTLRYRVLVVVATAVTLVGVASVVGLRIVTDRNAERQVHIAAQSVTTWGAVDGDVRVINGGNVAAVDAASTVVALLADDGRVVVATSGLPLTLPTLESVAGGLADGQTVRSDAGSRTFLFTAVPLSDDVVFDDGVRTPVDRALVGIGVEASDKLVTAMALAALGLLALVLAVVAAVTTVVVTRTTRALTDLTDRVESDALDGLADSTAAEFAETGAIATAIVRLDRRRAVTEQQLRDFVADASHELRTPLTTIQGWSELHFQRPADDAMTDRAFQSVVEESQRMRLLVDRLALLARAESGPAVRERVDLVALCRDAVEEATVLQTEATVELAADSAGAVLGDAAALTQVVRNLIGNSLLHGGPQVRVTISVARVGDEVQLLVADDGAGMTEAIRDRAFERFVTGDRRTGTGLGLPIVAAIVTAHGGTVALDSAPDAGTRVMVRFPAAP